MTEINSQLTKIVIILDAWQPVIGGGQKLFEEIATGLVKDYHCQIEIITRALKDQQGKKFNQTVKRLNDQLIITRLGPTAKWSNIFSRLWFTLQASFIALKKNPDLYLASTFLPALSLKLIKLFKTTPRALVVIGFGAKNKLYQKLEKFITQTLNYDLLITDDWQYYQLIKNKLNKNIQFIPNGVDLPKPANFKKHSRFTFLFVGRNEPRKGVHVLKSAFKQVKKTRPQTQLKLIGPGFKTVTDKQLQKELFQSHCLVLPSLKEGHPLILFEAWAHQLPVIATSVGSIANFVKPANGFLIPPNNPQALQKAMLQALRTKNLSKLGQNGYQLVKNYTWSKTVQKYYQAFTSLRQ